MKNTLYIKHYTSDPIGARKPMMTLWERIRTKIMGPRYLTITRIRITSLEHAMDHLRQRGVKDIIRCDWTDRNETYVPIVKDGKYLKSVVKVNRVTKAVRVVK